MLLLSKEIYAIVSFRIKNFSVNTTIFTPNSTGVTNVPSNEHTTGEGWLRTMEKILEEKLVPRRISAAAATLRTIFLPQAAAQQRKHCKLTELTLLCQTNDRSVVSYIIFLQKWKLTFWTVVSSMTMNTLILQNWQEMSSSNCWCTIYPTNLVRRYMTDSTGYRKKEFRSVKPTVPLIPNDIWWISWFNGVGYHKKI